jgi:asparagine synthase (glutamine-hydrolysing)
MCGIAGVLGAGERGRTVVRAMLDTMAHRGPDGDGIWASCMGPDRDIVLGHVRLAILDLSDAGRQPMLHRSGRLVITYNGELYNFREIRGSLEAAGVDFRSQSDTEVILEAYRRWGSDCLQQFNGMFAFAIMDLDRRVLFCARDRYGEKPFLYARTRDEFVFGSEFKAVLLHPDLPLEVDDWRLLRAAHNPGTGLDAERDTAFRGVQQLLPGEAMEVNLASLECRTWRYWQVRTEQTVEDDPAVLFPQFRELLVDSVRLRMRSDVPVGSCLSGGLDSSAIVCIVRQLLGPEAPYHTFTGRFPGTPADEWQHASQVIDATGVVSHVTEPTVEGFLAELPSFLWYNELPVGSSSQYAQWCVFRLAREHGVTVLLDGQGADECLGGYEQYFARYIEALEARGDRERLARELPLIRARYPMAMLPPARALRDRLPFRVKHWLSRRFGVGTNLALGLRVPVAERLISENELPRRPGLDPLRNALAQDTFGRFLTTLLRYGDRNSMAHSREVRLPFCDHRIAEFAFRVAPHVLMGDVQTKRILRESMRGILPEAIRTRWNKQGFRPPQDLWFCSPELLTLVRETFSSRSFRDSDCWDAEWWLRALRRVESGELALGWTLWQPFIDEQWRRHFLAPLVERRQRLAR